MEMQVGWFLGGLVRERCKTYGIAVAVDTDRENSGRELRSQLSVVIWDPLSVAVENHSYYVRHQFCCRSTSQYSFEGKA